jgi:lysophospholipase L1-like esterase
MSYEKLNLVNGDKLSAEHIAHIEDGIATADSAKYAGFKSKKVSIIGDSISTYEGYLAASEYAKYYPFSENNVKSVDQTWWKIVLDTAGMELHKNCAWSGCVVTGDSTSTSTAKCACSTKRINDLAKNGVAPDIVLVFVGTNNLKNETTTPIGDWDGKSVPAESNNIITFCNGYALMVAKILQKYPEAEVFLCTLLDTKRELWDNDNSSFPTNTENETLKDYNDKIRFIAEAYGVNVIDLHACGIRWFNLESYTSDTLHPNIAGMKLMARKVLAELSAKSIYGHPIE